MRSAGVRGHLRRGVLKSIVVIAVHYVVVVRLPAFTAIYLGTTLHDLVVGLSFTQDV